MRTNQRGQSGLQVLMLISVIFFLVTLITIFILNVQKIARDTERMTIIINIQKALDLYHDTYHQWPKGDDDGMGWDEGFHSKQDKNFIKPLIDKNFTLVTPSDPKFFGQKAIKYTVYEAGYGGCAKEKGNFYVLGITDLESDTRPPKNFTGSGFNCKNKDWQKDFDYVVGKFENK